MGMLKKMTELVADILNYLPWGEISPQTAQEVADHLLENDVVPVVQCKDCRWFDQTGFEEYNAPEEDLSLHIGWCKSWRKGTQACVFCSYGERKDDA